MTEAYRESPPPTREEFIGLEERMAVLEKRKPRAPFMLKLWHTFFAGITGVAGTIYAIGWLYDHYKDCGTRVSLYMVCGLVGLTSLVTSIVSLASTEGRERGFGSTWQRL